MIHPDPSPPPSPAPLLPPPALPEEPTPSSTSEACREWVQGLPVDSVLRATFRRNNASLQTYTPSELAQIDKTLAMEAEVSSSLNLTPLKVSSSLLERAVSAVSADGSHSIVQSSAIIMAPMMQVAAFKFCANQNFYKITNREEHQHSQSLKTPNEHAHVLHWGIRMPPPLKNRDGVFLNIFQKLPNDECIISIESTEHSGAGDHDAIRIYGARLWRFSAVSSTTTRFTATSTFGMGGSVPRFVSDSFTSPLAARAPLSAVRYFAQVRDPASFGEAEAKELGQLLVMATDEVRGKRDARQLEAKTATFVDRTTALRRARGKFPWLQGMLVEVLRDTVHRPSNTLTPLAEIGEEEGRKVGGAFALLQLKKVSPAAAVEAWIVGNSALGELTQEIPWFEGMMLGVSAEMRKRVPYGVKLRAYLGAGVSAADMISDTYIVSVFYSTGRSGTANSLLAMVGGNLLFQLIIVYAQTHNLKKDKWKTVVVEFLCVISFMKPGIDAYRVASGAEPNQGAAVALLMEMVYTKAGELIIEAVPGLVLQLVAVLSTEKNTASAYVSLLVSAASAAMTAATIFWDMDTSASTRRGNPDWMGLIPDLGRGTAFATIVLMCALQILAKAGASALLAVTNPAWLWYYVLGDHGLHIVYRIARRDWVYFVPMPVAASYAVAPLFRVMMKILVDFTACPLMRLPNVIGGTYYAYCLASSQVSVFVAVYLYNKYAVLPENVGKVEGGTLWLGTAGLATVWLITVSFFVFGVAVPRLRYTLWSWTTGRQIVQDYFLKGKEDENKFHIFTNNLLLWENELGDEVREWVKEGWAGWKEEGEPWFKVELVPDAFVPAEELVLMGVKRKRRGSAAGSIRESFREEPGE